MNQQTIKEIVDELRPALIGRRMGSVFQLSPFSFALDFRIRGGLYLFLAADAASPRLYLIARRTREIEKQSIALAPFGQALRSRLTGAELSSIDKDQSERVVRLNFQSSDETSEPVQLTLVVQLTGRSANLLVLDEQGRILHTLRNLKGPGQQVGEEFSPPSSRTVDSEPKTSFLKSSSESLSAAADKHYREIEESRAFDSQVVSAGARLRQEVNRLQKLQAHLRNDLASHGDPQQHKRLGDLLLANIGSAQRHGNRVSVQDFYTEGEPTIEIEVDEHTTLQAEAARYFGRYRKAKRAALQIAERLEESAEKLAELRRKQARLNEIAAARDPAVLRAWLEPQGSVRRKLPAGKRPRAPEKIPGTRRYLSSDGYEILVGRAARDNDQLTFRIARPNDLWLHAGDYPGSHVIVRNTSRKEIPQRTVIEAAQLAAKFSQASEAAKVNVHYTQRKFVSKIKGAAPGLVRLSSFRTLTVEPKESGQRA